MNPFIAMIVTALVKGTDLERGVAALIKLSSGIAMVADDHVALGQVMELAHKRLHPPAPPASQPQTFSLNRPPTPPVGPAPDAR